MKCSMPDRRLVDYLMGSLDEQERARVAAHVRDCPRCAARARRFADTIALVREAKIPEPDERTWRRVEAGIEARITQASTAGADRHFRRLRWAVPALAAAALIMALITGNGHVPPSTPPDETALALPETVSPERVAELADQIERLVGESWEDETDVLEAVDPELWPDDGELDALVATLDEELIRNDQSLDEHWSQEEAELFIQLYQETV